MVHHSTVVIIPDLHSGTQLQQETTGNPHGVDQEGNGQDLQG